MKSSRFIAVLLLLNLAVFGGILYYFRTQMGLGVASTSPEERASAGRTARDAAPIDPVNPTIVVTNQLRWTQLESEDYKQYVARLRAIGCPEETIRDIIIADLDKLMAPELRAAFGRRQELKFWHSEEEEMALDVDRRERIKKEREIEKRKRDIIRELVDADLERERMNQTGQDDYKERRLAFLPDDRRTQVRELLERYDQAEGALREKELDEGEPLSFAERTQLRQLRTQRETELNQLLTPAEREQYDLWLSSTANSIRYALYGMSATEEEFMTVYRVRKPFDDRWSNADVEMLDANAQAQRESARVQMESILQQSLGDDRYTEYKRGEDEDYHRLSALGTRYKLPKEKIVEAFGYKKVVLDYRAQVQSDANMNLQQKSEALRAIGDETDKALRTLLGDKPYGYYVRSGQAGWVRQ